MTSEVQDILQQQLITPPNIYFIGTQLANKHFFNRNVTIKPSDVVTTKDLRTVVPSGSGVIGRVPRILQLQSYQKQLRFVVTYTTPIVCGCNCPRALGVHPSLVSLTAREAHTWVYPFLPSHRSCLAGEQVFAPICFRC
jgi:hypothetical protein